MQGLSIVVFGAAGGIGSAVVVRREEALLLFVGTRARARAKAEYFGEGVFFGWRSVFGGGGWEGRRRRRRRDRGRAVGIGFKVGHYFLSCDCVASVASFVYQVAMLSGELLLCALLASFNYRVVNFSFFFD